MEKINLQQITLLVLDVDGVLTDGGITVNADGTESKTFNTLDGHAIKMWRRAGLKIAFLSGRQSAPTKHRAEQLQVDYVFENCHVKLPVLEKLVEELKITQDNVAYMGDDLPDLPAMRYAGFAVAPANAVEEIKRFADYVTNAAGGAGAVREIIEFILNKTGRWEKLLERYLA